jgi:hypothetical protein
MKIERVESRDPRAWEALVAPTAVRAHPARQR